MAETSPDSSTQARQKAWVGLRQGFEALGVPWAQDVETLRAYSQDLWPRKLLQMRRAGGPLEPQVDVVAWPESTAQVSALVRWAGTVGVALFPYGAGSGVCGAALVGGDRVRVLVDLKRLRALRSVDRDSMTIWAEAGWIGENLERELNSQGLTLGHFPSSIYCSSLGGYLATRSAGQLSTKYGKIEDLVVSVEFVLPDGAVIETGRAPRSAMGPDWTQLLLGSEGTLGFFTAARLQVSELAEKRIFWGLAADSLEQAMRFGRLAMQRGCRPAALRIYDSQDTKLAMNSEALKRAGFDGSVAVVVVFEGRTHVCEAEYEEARALARELELRDLGPSLGEHWWEHRYDVSYRQQLILSHDRMILDTFEVAATWDRLPEVYAAVKKVSVGAGVILAHLSHFYSTGANIYFTLVSHAGFKDPVDHYDKIWESILKAAFDAGATLSHHHGVGIQKKEWLVRERGALSPIFAAVKRAMDPKGIMNPGKMGTSD